MSQPIESSILQLLQNAFAVRTLVDDRLFFSIKPQNEERASVVITLVDKTFPRTFDGASDYSQGRLQFDCFAPTYKAAKELATAVRKTVDNRSGWQMGIDLDYVEVESESDIAVAIPTGKSAPSIYGVSLDVVFQHPTE